MPLCSLLPRTSPGAWGEQLQEAWGTFGIPGLVEQVSTHPAWGKVPWDSNSLGVLLDYCKGAKTQPSLALILWTGTASGAS